MYNWKPPSDCQESSDVWDLFFNLGKTHISKCSGPFPPPTQGLLNCFLIPPELGSSPSACPPPASSASVCTCLPSSTRASWVLAGSGRRGPPCFNLCSCPAPFSAPSLRESYVCILHVQACWGVSHFGTRMSLPVLEGRGQGCVAGGEEWIGPPTVPSPGKVFLFTRE